MAAAATMERETVSVEFGTWHAGSVDPETPVLVRMKPRSAQPPNSYAAAVREDGVSVSVDIDCSSATKAKRPSFRPPMPEIIAPLMEENIADNFFDSSLDEDEDVLAEAEEVAALVVDLESGLGPLKEKAPGPGEERPPRVTFGNVTNLVSAKPGSHPPAAAKGGANGKKKKTRHQRHQRVIGKLKEDLQAQQESHREAERIAKNSERLATEVAQRSQVQLTLMREALDDALRGENSAIEGWKISDETVTQLLELLRERETLWARAMWKYAYNAVLRRKQEGLGRLAREREQPSPGRVAATEEEAGGRGGGGGGGRRGRERRRRAPEDSARPRGARRDKASKSLRNLEESIDQLMEKLYNSQTRA